MAGQCRPISPTPPFFEGMTKEPEPLKDVEGAGVLALLGDSITTDHISPAGNIKTTSPAGIYLSERQVPVTEFNSYGSRRGNHDVMMRGTFANIRIKNLMAPGTEGGVTKYFPGGEEMSIFDAAMKYKDDGKDLVIFAGSLYGNGSSRDWAAKGTRLLGVRAVLAKSFERIHRSNLIGMGVLPLQLPEVSGWQEMRLTGEESVTIAGVANFQPRQRVQVTITFPGGETKMVAATLRIDTENEMEYYRHGGILHLCAAYTCQCK